MTSSIHSSSSSSEPYYRNPSRQTESSIVRHDSSSSASYGLGGNIGVSQSSSNITYTGRIGEGTYESTQIRGAESGTSIISGNASYTSGIGGYQRSSGGSVNKSE